jgi:hypothetical protein
MPLINCPECYQQISSDAIACPRCGKPIPQSLAKTKVGLPAFFIILGLFFFVPVFALSNPAYKPLQALGVLLMIVGVIFLVVRLVMSRLA